jgi:hypothetical protein
MVAAELGDEQTLPSLGMNRRCRSEGIGKYGVRHCENADKIN